MDQELKTVALSRKHVVYVFLKPYLPFFLNISELDHYGSLTSILVVTLVVRFHLLFGDIGPVIFHLAEDEGC